MTTALYITADQNGEMAVVEMVPQIPGQMNLDNEVQQSPKVLKLVANR